MRGQEKNEMVLELMKYNIFELQNEHEMKLRKIIAVIGKELEQLQV